MQADLTQSDLTQSDPAFVKTTWVSMIEVTEENDEDKSKILNSSNCICVYVSVHIYMSYVINVDIIMHSC